MSGLLQPDQQIAISLPAQQWDFVMRFLAKQPYEMVVGLIGEMQRQCQVYEATTRQRVGADDDQRPALQPLRGSDRLVPRPRPNGPETE